MEPELFALARRMHAAYLARGVTDGAERESVQWDWDALLDIDPEENRAWLAAAIVARPDLADGLRVPKGHWAEGVLPVEETPA